MTKGAASAGEMLERAAAHSLAEALALVATLRGRELRERHRQLLTQAIEQAERAVAAADGLSMPRALSVLARAHTARAEDALHGAGQLSLSAQRAPTISACDEGWRRVETIVATAVDAAAAAKRAAALLQMAPSPAARNARTAAEKANAAAHAAHQLVETRNHAYTFHADYAFSFGEGWYLAAAGLLAGIAIQIEPGQPATAQATRFLREAGLSDRVQPYRSRPRANKQTTEIVARAFRVDPESAQRKLRAAFLGQSPIANSVNDFVDARLAGRPDRKKVLLWIRHSVHHPGRNTDLAELRELCARTDAIGLVPILVGDALREGSVPAEAIDLTLFWKESVFRGEDGRRAQLQFFEHLRHAHGVVGQVGVTTAGMDGPALMGMPTMYLTDASNVRMREWVGAVPGYREIVRGSGYLDRISEALAEWAAASQSRFR
jgi:hypothetical protein